MDALASLAEADESEDGLALVKRRKIDGGVVLVSILSGFLGAGKTTTLKYWLRNKKEMKVGVVVNDVAKVNIDAKEVKRAFQNENGIEVVQMENGCACCSASDDLFKSLMTLIGASSELDHVFIECSGVAEPKRMWDGLQVAFKEEQVRLRLFKLITVVDASLVLDKLLTMEFDVMEKLKDDATRYVCDLFVEQVESADLLVVNKIDLLENENKGRKKVTSILQAMNPTATIQWTLHGALDLDLLLKEEKPCSNAALSVEEEHKDLAKWIENRKNSSPENGVVKTFVYRKRIPFDPHAFAKTMISERPECLGGCVLRSKGYVWLANQNEMTLYFSRAGKHATLVPIGAWWASIPEKRWPSSRMPEDIKADFDGPFGDRRQEIVFIGVEMDQVAIQAALDGCLLSENKMKELFGDHM